MDWLMNLKTAAVKRVYLRALRKTWRAQKRLDSMTRYHPNWKWAHEIRSNAENTANAAKEELNRRGWWAA